jgi:hypothetical protein
VGLWISASRVKRDESELAGRCAEPDTIIYERDGVEERVAIPEGVVIDADTELEALSF